MLVKGRTLSEKVMISASRYHHLAVHTTTFQTARGRRGLHSQVLTTRKNTDIRQSSPKRLSRSSTMSADKSSSEFTITLLGDIMLGRLIDQLLPTHVNEPDEAATVSRFRRGYAHLENYTHLTPWGNTLSLLGKSDLVLGNLETSVTTHDVKWPDKVFNYRMHPDNVKCLTDAGIDYVSLANNHTLDFSQEGLLETVRSLQKASIAYAGASDTVEGATLPAKLTLQPHQHDLTAGAPFNIHVYSFSDHPKDWQPVREFNFIEYTQQCKQRLQDMLTAPSPPPQLKIVSVHWGPNYRWQPDQDIRDMAHFFIDSCEIDVVWGHSSHHIQGVEIYAGKVIIYGCGDFVDDYAVNPQYRNDLSAAWNLKLEAIGGNLLVKRLQVWPNRIKDFQANLLDESDQDHRLVVNTFKDLCTELGTAVNKELGSGGQIVVDLTKQSA